MSSYNLDLAIEDKTLLARQCAQLWVETRERLDYPFGVWEESPSVPHPLAGADKKSCEVTAPWTFVLEIGSEELPRQDVTSAISQLEAVFPQLLSRERLQRGYPSIQGIPCRLVVVVQHLTSIQEDVV